MTVSTYHARVGEEDAIIGLHEDWQRTLQSKAKGFLSGELLRNIKNSAEFLSIMRFESRQAAHALANNAEHHVWLLRLTSLAKDVPVLTEYTNEWQSYW